MGYTSLGALFIHVIYSKKKNCLILMGIHEDTSGESECILAGVLRREERAL